MFRWLSYLMKGRVKEVKIQLLASYVSNTKIFFFNIEARDWVRQPLC